MSDVRPLCDCEVCLSPSPAEYVIPQPALEAIRRRRARAGADRPYCPRCGELLGRVEVLVDAVSYSHFVQPCSGCLALWVVS
jgi:hypothetical protein